MSFEVNVTVIGIGIGNGNYGLLGKRLGTPLSK